MSGRLSYWYVVGRQVQLGEFNWDRIYWSLQFSEALLGDSCPPKNMTELKPYKKRLNVHHFKWMKGQYEATKYKANVWENTSVGEAYKNVLVQLERCQGICVKTKSIKCMKQNFNARNNVFHSQSKDAI